MDKCPKCGYVEEECEVSGCHEQWEWEGWYRVVDPFLHTPTGLMQKRKVCDEHGYLLDGSTDQELNGKEGK